MEEMNKVNDNPILSPKKLRKVLAKLMNAITSMLGKFMRKQDKTFPILKPKL